MIKYSNNIGKITKIIDGRGVEGGRERIQNDVWNIYLKLVPPLFTLHHQTNKEKFRMSVLHYMLCCQPIDWLIYVASVMLV